MPHEDYMQDKGNSKSKYSGGSKSGKMGGMEGGYGYSDMKGTVSDNKPYFRPMDSYKKGHEY